MDPEEVRDRTGAIWSLGRYEVLAEHLVPAADAVAGAAGDGAGRLAVDVAAGNGNAAVALAGRAWRVTATDIAPRMIELGTARTAGTDVEWRRADMTDMPFDDGTFDLAVSTFGLIFAPEPTVVVAEVRRVLATGGRLILTAWTDDGYVAQMTSAMSPWLPSNGGPDPFAWGRPSQVRDWLGAVFDSVEVDARTLPWRFESARAGREVLARYSPGHVAAQNYAGDQAELMMDAVEAELDRLAEPDGRIDLGAEYLLVVAS